MKTQNPQSAGSVERTVPLVKASRARTELSPLCYRGSFVGRVMGIAVGSGSTPSDIRLRGASGLSRPSVSPGLSLLD